MEKGKSPRPQRAERGSVTGGDGQEDEEGLALSETSDHGLGGAGGNEATAVEDDGTAGSADLVVGSGTGTVQHDVT
jgi:hypothetical protein